VEAVDPQRSPAGTGRVPLKPMVDEEKNMFLDVRGEHTWICMREGAGVLSRSAAMPGDLPASPEVRQ